MSKSLFLTTLAVLGLLTHSMNAEAAVGRTSGSFAVSSSGAATYQIPIW
jgi:hypothetical protein